MKMTVIGAGYVGLTIGLCLAHSGHQVMLLERDAARLSNLKAGQCPFYEPDAQKWLTEVLESELLSFTDSPQIAVPFGKVIWIAVNTPSQADGRLDTSALTAAINDILTVGSPESVVVIKSTVTAGTCRQLLHWMCSPPNSFRGTLLFSPEFLREGHAIEDFMCPSRLVLGTEQGIIPPIIEQIYQSLGLQDQKIIVTTYENAEITKQASNGFLAVKLTYINELANYCDLMSADIGIVSYCMGLDPRIAPGYMKPGLGYGGSCLPKDTKALTIDASTQGASLTVLEQAMVANTLQTKSASAVIRKYMPAGSRLAVWGVTFKPGSGDMRDSPACVVLQSLVEDHMYRFQIFDPFLSNQQLPEFFMSADVEITTNFYAAAKDADALLILTAHDQFYQCNFHFLKAQMRGNLLFDFFYCVSGKTAESAGLKLIRETGNYSSVKTLNLDP